jgi:vacuolar-type H+-ATPase subunit E/Vma4
MPNQEEKLQQEILEDAERKARRAIERARRDAEKLLEAARQENEKKRAEQLAAAQHRADERVNAVQASISHDKQQMWLAAREEVINEVLRNSLAAIYENTGEQRRETCRQLLKEALAAMGSDQVTIVVAEPDVDMVRAEILPQVASDLGLDTANCQVVGSARIKAGVLVETADRRRRYDNTLDGRAFRMKERLRADILAALEAESAGNEETSHGEDRHG